jgi:hypothetical protein
MSAWPRAEEGGAHRTTPIACVSIASTQSRAETRGRARVDVRSDPAARWIKRARCAQAAPEASLVHAPETPLLTVWLDVAHVSHLEAVNSWEARTASSSSEFFRVGKRSANENGGFDHQPFSRRKM